MIDLYTHIRMKSCCRKALKKLDLQVKNATGAKKVDKSRSFLTRFGDKAIDAARRALPGGGALAEAVGAAAPNGALEGVLRELCATICEQHAAEHEGTGEKSEVTFWQELKETLTDGRALQHACTPFEVLAPDQAKSPLNVGLPEVGFGASSTGERTRRNAAREVERQ